MKHFLPWLVCLVLLVDTAYGQRKEAVRLTKDDSEIGGSNWRFHPGDNMAWADSAFSDREWPKSNTSKPIYENEALWRAGRGWYRLQFHARPSIHNKDLLLTIEQFGSSEIYLDGRRLAVVKPVTFDSGGSQRIIKFIPIRFADTSQHILAVRYQFRREPVLYASVSIDPIRIGINNASEAGTILVETARWTTVMNTVFAGVFGLLALLHFLFYRANRTGLVNRTLALTMLCFALNFALGELEEYSGLLKHLSFLALTANASLHLGFTLLLTAVYQYLHMRRRWIYYGVVGLLVLDLLSLLIPETTMRPIDNGGVPFLLALADYIRVSWLGRKTGDADARLPWNSLKVAIYCFLLVLTLAITLGTFEGVTKINFDEYIMVPIIILSSVALFSIPVGLSFSLVRDYTRTHKALGDNLLEVEQLSARTLAQEQEKQLILARQNELLEQQVQERTAALNQSLDDLKATQDQLVQREKLASLGELTAGIAHEIQNPLNFVNNFAEVSVELVEELVEERQKGPDRDEALEVELLSDLGQNVQKISEHGKRAASIVRGMLQHSRASSGQKLPTDLNELVDEYLKLAYHGLRAKDKSFNAHLKTDFASDLPAANAVADDIGRVLVNLFNNAFYAVQQKEQAMVAKKIPFAPTVSVQTTLEGNTIKICVRDNGFGIPEEIRQKIFQPFFTTKPTGEGTGLGLSLSYDIVSKGHGGTLSVSSEPGEFTEFVITLPYNTHSGNNSV